jgi:hypothetical protein
VDGQVPSTQLPLQHSKSKRHDPPSDRQSLQVSLLQMPLQQSPSVVQGSLTTEQQVLPFWQKPRQHVSPAAQDPPWDRHGWQLNPGLPGKEVQMRLQHSLSLVQVLPFGVQQVVAQLPPHTSCPDGHSHRHVAQL